MRNPTDRQMQFASTIARTLGIELPVEKTRQSLFLFIRDNKSKFEEKMLVDRHNARVNAVAYASEDPMGPDDSDWALMDAMGIDSLTGGFDY